MKKIPPKRLKFIEHYTNEKNKETYLNGTRSVMKAYNNEKPEVAKVMAHDILTNTNVQKAIEKKILKKEDIQNNLARMTDKIERAIGDNVSVENIPIVREFREFHHLQAKINGDLQERINNNYTQIVINGALQSPFDTSKEVEDTSNGGGGEE